MHGSVSFVRYGLGWCVAMGLAVATSAQAQPPATLRVAFVSQWAINQHRQATLPWVHGPLVPELRAALDGGVVERVVFSWQRGLIQRSALVGKPVGVLGGPEAAALGGRGEFRIAVRPPSGAAAWTAIEVVPEAGGPDNVLVLEIGGELSTVRQALETLLVVPPPPDRPPTELALAGRALIPSNGVLVLREFLGRPVAVPDAPKLFRGAAGVEFLVVRSPLETLPDGALTPSGLADAAVPNSWDWREGDRVFIRVPLTTLRAGAPGIVLGWKDRVLKPDRDGPEKIDPRRSSAELRRLR